MCPSCAQAVDFGWVGSLPSVEMVACATFEAKTSRFYHILSQRPYGSLAASWVSPGCLCVPSGCFWMPPGCLVGVSWVSPRCLLGVSCVPSGRGSSWVLLGCVLETQRQILLQIPMQVTDTDERLQIQMQIQIQLHMQMQMQIQIRMQIQMQTHIQMQIQIQMHIHIQIQIVH